MSYPGFLIALIVELPNLAHHVDIRLESFFDLGPEIWLVDVAIVIEPHHVCVVGQVIEHSTHHRILIAVLVRRVHGYK